MSTAQRADDTASGDDFDLAVERHQPELDEELRVALVDLGAQGPHLGRVQVELLLALEILAEDHLVGAAIAVVDDDDLADVVQVERDLDMLPEGLAPGGELVVAVSRKSMQLSSSASVPAAARTRSAGASAAARPAAPRPRSRRRWRRHSGG